MKRPNCSRVNLLSVSFTQTNYRGYNYASLIREYAHNAPAVKVVTQPGVAVFINSVSFNYLVHSGFMKLPTKLLTCLHERLDRVEAGGGFNPDINHSLFGHRPVILQLI